MGPSGAGKSTLLHLIGGLEPPSAGRIRVGDHVLSELDDDGLARFRRRCAGFVFQQFNLLPTLTAEENVALPLLLDGRDRRDAHEHARAVLERFGLSHRRNHRPPALSGGEMQRVAIARALAPEPLVILADEPTGSLDTKTGEEILALLARSVRDAGVTIVMVTHDPRASSCGDRVVVIRDGAIVEDDDVG